MRGHRKQFEPVVAEQIEGIIRRVEILRYPTGPSRYYGLDLAMCLSSGALAGSLVVSSALMEIYIRGLVIRYTEVAQSDWSRKVNAELELEEMRKEDFNRLLEHLVRASLFVNTDAEIAKRIYKEVRIPMHHGLPSRLLGRTKDDPFGAIVSLVGRSGEVSMQVFENFVEHEALPIIDNIVGVLYRNQVKDYA